MFRRDKSFLAQRFCCLATKCTYHWIVCWHQFQLPDNNSYTPLLSGQFRFFAKVTGALLTRVTVVPTQPIKTLNLLRSERTVYAVSNSWMETKQAVLPLSAPVSTSILLCFGNRHNHITVFDETVFVSSMTLYQQAGQAGTNSQFLNQILQIRIQKRLLGFSQTRHSAQNCADRASYPLKALWPTRGPVPSSPLSFCQSFHRLFLQPAESGVFSNLFVDTARFLW